MISEMMCSLRNTSFWLLDSLKGGFVKKAYERLRKFEKMDSKDPELLGLQQTALQSLLHHSLKTTAFYEKLQCDGLSSFPVINKAIIREQQNAFISSKFDKASLSVMTTSGSTGTPFVCYQDSIKRKAVNAEVIYYSEKAGYSVGKKIVFLRVLTEKSQKSKLHQWIQNEKLLDISNLDDWHIEILLENIKTNSKKGAMLLAYASTLDALCDYFLRKGASYESGINLSGIVSSSEILNDNTRDIVRNVFNCQCFSRYSNQENGVIGQDDVKNNVFIINEAHYLVEVLEMETDEPTAEGEIGRIVITDLYNYAMPMIRYDTGDIGAIVYVTRNNLTKKAIANFGGRKVDVVYDCDGNRLSPHIITNNLWSFPEICQFQFIQESGKRYTIKINTKAEFQRSEELRMRLIKLLGADSEIDIASVDELPVLASGKRKYIVNNMHLS
jgi:phenylacetate-CoA ligase